jgi:asparagine synthase (glutamine-hydrolysing)
MCGIAGFIARFDTTAKYRTALRSMAGALVHRGPDTEGFWLDADNGVGLAHRRLSIIDLSCEGNQPMASPSGRYVIVYNGEVYNFGDLRRELDRANIPWRGNSDTEVILAAIEFWGLKEALEKFVGMFAFGLWDRADRVLYLVRDRLGIKPLYYARTANGLVFASELKAIKRYPDFAAAVNRDALALFLRHSCIPAPHCIYRNTWKLEPGHMVALPVRLVSEGAERPRPLAYWDAGRMATAGQQKALAAPPDEDVVQRLEALLRDAVKIRMISDVPLGAFLSGGIDSSTVVALMQAQSLRPIKTFTIGFFESAYDEAKDARAVADYLGTDHTELYLTPEATLDAISVLPHIYDEPFADASQLPTYLLSRLTRRYVTVSLSGDGGDELFAGYNRYLWGRRIWNILRWVPGPIGEKAAAVLKGLSPARLDWLYQRLEPFMPARYRFRLAGDKIHKVTEILGSKNFNAMYYALIANWKAPRQVVLNSHALPTRIDTGTDGVEQLDAVHKIMYLDLISYLPDDILTKVDRASMSVSLEARVPLLDHRVVEFAWSLPLGFKLRRGQNKWILKQLLQKYIPAAYTQRPKMGFEMPIAAWLRGPLREWAESLLDEQRLAREGFFNPEPVRRRWQQHLSGKMNFQFPLWDILMFQAWYAGQ